MIDKHRQYLFVVLDTTGLNPEKHEIIKIQAVLRNESQWSTIAKKARPENPKAVDPRAMEYNGIDLHDALNWPPQRDLFRAIVDMLTGYKVVLVGHNVSFVLGFLEALFKVNGDRLSDYAERWSLDTIDLARWYKYTHQMQFENLKLPTISRYFNIPTMSDELGRVRALVKTVDSLRLMQ